MKEFEIKINVQNPIRVKSRNSDGKVILGSDMIQMYLQIFDGDRELDWRHSFLRPKKLFTREKGKSITLEIERGGHREVEIVIKAPDTARYKEYQAKVTLYWARLRNTTRIGLIGNTDSENRPFANPLVTTFTLDAHAKDAQQQVERDRFNKGYIISLINEVAKANHPDRFRAGSWAEKYNYINSLIIDDITVNKFDKLFTGRRSIYGMIQAVLTNSNIFSQEERRNIQDFEESWKKSYFNVLELVEAGGKLKHQIKERLQESIMTLGPYSPKEKITIADLGKRKQFYFQVNKSGKILKVNKHAFSEHNGFNDPRIAQALYIEVYNEIGVHIMEYVKQSSKIVLKLEENILRKDKEIAIGSPDAGVNQGTNQQSPPQQNQGDRRPAA